MYVCRLACICHRSEDNLHKLVPSFHHEDNKDLTLVQVWWWLSLYRGPLHWPTALEGRDERLVSWGQPGLQILIRYTTHTHAYKCGVHSHSTWQKFQKISGNSLTRTGETYSYTIGYLQDRQAVFTQVKKHMSLQLLFTPSSVHRKISGWYAHNEHSSITVTARLAELKMRVNLATKRNSVIQQVGQLTLLNSALRNDDDGEASFFNMCVEVKMRKIQQHTLYTK